QLALFPGGAEGNRRRLCRSSRPSRTWACSTKVSVLTRCISASDARLGSPARRVFSEANLPKLAQGNVVSGVRKRLLRFAPAFQQLRARSLEQLVGVADGEVVAAFVLVELAPGDRGGDGRAFAGAGRIGHHRGRSALVAQPVEEDAPLALNLADIGGEHVRLGFRYCAAEALGEVRHGGPVRRLTERRHDVQALAA